jgi:hypothetical protein
MCVAIKPLPVKISPLLAAAVLPASLAAHPIKWTATGKVTSATAAAFPGVAVDDAVEVAFSYDSEAIINGLAMVPIGSRYQFKTEFAGDIDLKMSVKIGESMWEAALPYSELHDTYALHSLSWDGGGSPDTLTVLLTSTDNATFPSFPYGGLNAARRMELILSDKVTPCDLLIGHSLPDGGTDVSQISEASGSIAAGSDTLRFSLDLASIEVIEEEPKIPLSFERTLTGFELKWFGEPGAVYTLFKSEDMADWEHVSDHEGLDEHITVPVGPFESLPAP